MIPFFSSRVAGCFFTGPTSLKLVRGAVAPSWRKMVVLHQPPYQANGTKMAYQENPNISPARDLKIHLSSAISEVIHFLESLSMGIPRRIFNRTVTNTTY